MRNLPPNVLARFDANEGVFLDNELESVDPTEYMELYAGLMARKLIPLASNVDPYALSYSYSMWSMQGKAKARGPGAKDDTRVTVTRTKKISPIIEIPVSFGWSIDDIKRAAKAGIKLEQATVQAAMSTVARKIDRMLAFGEAGTDATGLLNNPNVLTTTPVAKTGGGTLWTTAAKKSELLADIKKIVNDARTALQQASNAIGGESTPEFDRWVVALPTAYYGLVDEPRSDNVDTTVIEMAKKSQFIEDIVEWNLLDTADDGDPMIVAFPRNEMAVAGIVGREWDQRAPQEQGHEIHVPVMATCGGTVIRYPVAVRYIKFS